MLRYNSNIHRRRSIRLKKYDYSQNGGYFITICCHNRLHRFGMVENGEMVLNELGKIAFDEWVKLPQRFPHINVDVFQIMPNHMHGIILINHPDINTNPVGAGLSPAQLTHNDTTNAGLAPAQLTHNDTTNAGFTPAHIVHNDCNMDNNGTVPTSHESTARVAPTVADIIGAYKSLVSNRCLDVYKSKNAIMGKLWQRNYYEQIIRNETSCQNVSAYIVNNPATWENDTEFTSQ